MPVPFLDLKAQHSAIRAEIDAAIAEVIDSGRFIGGPVLEAFESEFAAYCGVKQAMGVANGTDALQLALRACGVGAGDEVITASFTFTATAEAIVNMGARPVFVDVDDTYTMDVSQLADKITPRTKAIIPVQLYGQTADMAPLMALAEQHGLIVIEDAAQAQGSLYQGRRAGSLGHIACFSFYVGKNLGALGDAGAVVTDNDAWAQAVRTLRDHGRSGHYLHEIVGYNSRLDTIQAAVLRIKLRHLDAWNAFRRNVAQTYSAALEGTGLSLPRVAKGASTSFISTWCAPRTGKGCARDWRRPASAPESTIRFLFTCSLPTAPWGTSAAICPIARRGPGRYCLCRCSPT
jgi:dTDP-4-amino-4,6-dideoxygalactose transaminase